MNEITVNVEREADDDCYIYTAQASKLGKSAFATGYTGERATERAIKKLNTMFGLKPNSPNFENTVEAFLCR
jgi:hypothetical protein